MSLRQFASALPDEQGFDCYSKVRCEHLLFFIYELSGKEGFVEQESLQAHLARLRHDLAGQPALDHVLFLIGAGLLEAVDERPTFTLVGS